MEKVVVDGKEIQIEKGNVKQLSEEALDAVHGGAQSLNIYRWFCPECDAKGTRWYSTLNAAEHDFWESHHQDKLHWCYEIEMAYFINE